MAGKAEAKHDGGCRLGNEISYQMGFFLGAMNAVNFCHCQSQAPQESIAKLRLEILSKFKGFWEALGPVARLAWWKEPEDIFDPCIKDDIVNLLDESASVEADPVARTFYEETFAGFLAGIDRTKAPIFH